APTCCFAHSTDLEPAVATWRSFCRTIQKPVRHNVRASAAKARARALRFTWTRTRLRRLQALVGLRASTGQFVARIWRNIRNPAQNPIEQLWVRPAAAVLEVFDRQQGRGLLRNSGRDELIDRDVVLLGKFTDLAVQRVRKSKAEAAHRPSSSAAR